jgi:hypothetical protein
MEACASDSGTCPVRKNCISTAKTTTTTTRTKDLEWQMEKVGFVTFNTNAKCVAKADARWGCRNKLLRCLKAPFACWAVGMQAADRNY